MYSKSISVVLASLAIVVVGSITFINSMSFSVGTMQFVVYKSIPAALALGVLGFLIGVILDNAKRRR